MERPAAESPHSATRRTSPGRTPKNALRLRSGQLERRGDARYSVGLVVRGREEHPKRGETRWYRGALRPRGWGAFDLRRIATQVARRIPRLAPQGPGTQLRPAARRCARPILALP